MEEITLEGLSLFHERWALLAAGTQADHNAMTISWGGMGTLWNKQVVTVYVKPLRYTYDFMESNDKFTVSFFPDEYRQDLNVMGTITGRGRTDDKEKDTRLNVIDLEGTVGYAQAEVTLVCRKLYAADLIPANMPPNVVKYYYQTEEPHRMYIGEVLSVIRK